MKSVTGKNAIATLFGGLLGPAIGLLMTPFYLRQIGLDGLGLVGLMVVINSVLGLFIAGASKTYQRDVATAQEASPGHLAGLVKGGLFFFAFMGASLGLLVFTFGHDQIHEMAKGTSISRRSVDQSLLFISIIMANRIFSGVIGSTLGALRDLVWTSSIGMGMGILGAITTWYFLSRAPRVDVFYACQLSVGLIGTLLVAARLFWLAKCSFLKTPQQPMKEVWSGRIRENGKLAGLLVFHEGLGAVITQIDRLLVTSFLPLSALGAYNLGANPARMVTTLTSPINIVVYPELCRLAARDATRQEAGEYIARISFILCLIFAAVITVLIASADDLMNLWLGAAHVPKQAAACLVMLSAGHLLLAIAALPYHLTVVHGRVGYGIKKNILAILILPPLGYFALGKWGLPGAALVWLTYGFGCVVICGWVAFTRHADIAAGRKWIAASVGVVCAATLVSTALSFVPLEGWAMIITASTLSAGFCAAFVFYLFGSDLRTWLHAMELKPAPIHTALEHR